MKKFIMYTSFIILTILIITNAQSSIEYARRGLMLCGEMIVPSLFPFFICSGLLIYSGFAELLSKICTPVMLPLFRINGSGSAAFVLGIISGYPLGAITACSLYENNYLSKTETERLLAFCNNSGPLFILGAVGISLYKSPLIGWLLYTAHLVAAVCVGIIFRFYGKNNFIAPKIPLSQPDRKLGEIFSVTLQNSISSILTVCGAIIFFSVTASIIIDTVSVNSWYTPILTGIIEFTTGVVGLAGTDLSLLYRLVLSAFIIGFAGISVHFQVMGIVARHDLSLKPYILGKLLHALLSALFTFALLKFIPVSTDVFAPTQSPLNIDGSFAVSSLCICTAVIGLCTVGILLGIWEIFVNKKILKNHCE